MKDWQAILAILGVIGSVTVVGVTAVWKIANFFRDRPSRTEVQSMMDQKLRDVEIARTERHALATRVGKIELDMARQGAMIENIDKNVDLVVKRLDQQGRSRPDTQG